MIEGAEVLEIRIAWWIGRGIPSLLAVAVSAVEDGARIEQSVEGDRVAFDVLITYIQAASPCASRHGCYDLGFPTRQELTPTSDRIFAAANTMGSGDVVAALCQCWFRVR